MSSRPLPSVAIVGGGVIGLAIGWRLAAAGAAVTVFERDEAGRGASWAAAGMLAAGVETEPGELDLLALNRRSQELWPGFAAELEAAAGMSVGLRQRRHARGRARRATMRRSFASPTISSASTASRSTG